MNQHRCSTFSSRSANAKRLVPLVCWGTEWSESLRRIGAVMDRGIRQSRVEIESGMSIVESVTEHQARSERC